MLIVTTTVFTLLYLTPGDPAGVILGPDATPERINELRERLGLNDPWHVQLLRWYGNLLKGDLGNSLSVSNHTVVQAIAERAEPTILLTLFSLSVALLIGVPTGIVSALGRGRWVDALVMFVAILGVSMPTFWLGLNLIYVFAVTLRVLPLAGYQGLDQGIGETVRYLIMPAVTLGLAQGALLARMTRSMMLETLGEDYVRTARAKGLNAPAVVIRHALRNALIPLVTVIGLSFAVLMGGAVITEQVFNIPGIGRLLISAIGRRDYPLVQGIVLLIALMYVLINLAVDIVYGVLDPRLRQSRA
jgi:peptide/nickel transport system permease protein